jgi:hypothetical protein
VLRGVRDFAGAFSKIVFSPLRSAARRLRQTIAWTVALRALDRSHHFCVAVADPTGPNLVEFVKRLLISRMSEEAMSGSAKTLSPRAGRWTLIATAILALLGSATAPAKAGDFDAPYGYDYGRPRYEYGPPRYGYSRYRYDDGPYRYHHSCSSCGCYSCGRRQYSARPGGVFERRYRYIEKEYVERRYTSPVRRYTSYGWHPSYQGYRTSYPGYRTLSAPFPWGYGGVRRSSYGYGDGPSADYDAEPPRPPAPVGYDDEPHGYEGRGWGVD